MATKKSTQPTEQLKKSILTTAIEIIYGDREQTYGTPDKNINCIAEYWGLHLKHKYGADFVLDSDDVCAMMRLVKEARLINSPRHKDNLVDLAGYAALQERCQECVD